MFIIETGEEQPVSIARLALMISGAFLVVGHGD
jgi:hypothetical protein